MVAGSYKRRIAMAEISDHTIAFQCRECTHQMRQTVGWLKVNTVIVCPGCGSTIRLNADKLVESVKAMEQAFERQPRAIQIETR
jgi:transcription elongation factor Elf1